MKYCWLIIILLFSIKLLKDKPLSSYNIKWMLAYVYYLLWLHIDVFNIRYIEEEIDNYIYVLFVIPLNIYLIFPFIWKFLLKFKLFKYIESKIDAWYNTIKDLS